MRSLVKAILVSVLIAAGFSASALGQGPLQKRVNFDVSVPYSMRMADYLLPAGHYVLFQIDQNNLNLFGLYQDDLTHPPIAWVRTTRIDYESERVPEKAEMLLATDETRSIPIIRGWTIPGDDGWEVIAVYPKGTNDLVHVR
jgi:hypothetical protein